MAACVCLRVRWKALNGMTGRSRPSDVLLVWLTQTAGDTRRRDLSGWHGQLQSCTRGIKSDRTRCDKWRPCEGKVCSEGVTAMAAVQHTMQSLNISKLKVTVQTGVVPSFKVAVLVVLRGK